MEHSTESLGAATLLCVTATVLEQLYPRWWPVAMRGYLSSLRFKN